MPHFHVADELGIAAFADDVRDGWDVDENFPKEGGVFAVVPQDLGGDGAQDGGERQADFRFFFRRERMHDAPDGLQSAAVVEGGEDEMARLGSGERGGHRLAVAELSDHEDVGIFAHGGADAFGKIADVASDFPLPDERFLGNV